MNNITLKNETFNSLTIQQQKNIAEDAQKIITNTLALDGIKAEKNGAFSAHDGQTRYIVSEGDIYHFLSVVLDLCDNDTYEDYIETAKDDNELLHCIGVIVMCAMIAAQRYPNRTNTIPPEAYQQHQKYMRMHDFGGFPSTPVDLYARVVY